MFAKSMFNSTQKKTRIKESLGFCSGLDDQAWQSVFYVFFLVFSLIDICPAVTSKKSRAGQRFVGTTWNHSTNRSFRSSRQFDIAS